MAGVWPRRNEAPSKVKCLYHPIPGGPGHGSHSATPRIILLQHVNETGKWSFEVEQMLVFLATTSYLVRDVWEEVWRSTSEGGEGFGFSLKD